MMYVMIEKTYKDEDGSDVGTAIATATRSRTSRQRIDYPDRNDSICSSSSNSSSSGRVWSSSKWDNDFTLDEEGRNYLS